MKYMLMMNTMRAGQSLDWPRKDIEVMIGFMMNFNKELRSSGELVAAAAFSARLFLRGTTSLDESLRTCAENRGASADTGQNRIAVRRPPSSAIGTGGRHDHCGSSFLFSWRGVSEGARTQSLADAVFDRVSGC